MPKLKPVALCLALAAPLATPAMADPALGVGLNIVFGGNQGPEVGVGVRLFSDNRQDEFAGTLGLDYMFSSNSFRGSLGAAYLFDGTYFGGDVGFDFRNGAPSFGVGAGILNTEGAPTMMQPPPG
jgi:hypothetical protein